MDENEEFGELSVDFFRIRRAVCARERKNKHSENYRSCFSYLIDLMAEVSDNQVSHQYEIDHHHEYYI